MVKLLLNKQKCFYPLALLWFLQIDLEQNELTTKCKPPFFPPALYFAVCLHGRIGRFMDFFNFSSSPLFSDTSSVT
eukprot:g6538.t1